MQYSRILSLIDAELARLLEARQILASLRLVADKIQTSPSSPGRPETSGDATLSKPDTLEIAVPVSPSPEPVLKANVTRPKRTAGAPRRTRRVAPKPVIAPIPTALGGIVSQSPVFVPAEEIRQALAQRVQARTTEISPSDSAASDPLTTELLARKWLHSSTS
jgi:hypothetical protein